MMLLCCHACCKTAAAVLTCCPPCNQACTAVAGCLLQAEEIVELCDNAERLFKQEKSVLELRVRGSWSSPQPRT